MYTRANPIKTTSRCMYRRANPLKQRICYVLSVVQMSISGPLSGTILSIRRQRAPTEVVSQHPSRSWIRSGERHKQQCQGRSLKTQLTSMTSQRPSMQQPRSLRELFLLTNKHAKKLSSLPSFLTRTPRGQLGDSSTRSYNQ